MLKSKSTKGMRSYDSRKLRPIVARLAAEQRLEPVAHDRALLDVGHALLLLDLLEQVRRRVAGVALRPQLDELALDVDELRGVQQRVHRRAVVDLRDLGRDALDERVVARDLLHLLDAVGPPRRRPAAPRGRRDERVRRAGEEDAYPGCSSHCDLCVFGLASMACVRWLMMDCAVKLSCARLSS